MKTAILFIGGASAPGWIVHRYAGGVDCIAAADSGLDAALEYGFTPQLIVGDMDSVSQSGLPERVEGAEVVRASREKDSTDTELAFNLLDTRGFGRVILAGGGSSHRMDHEIAILYLFERKRCPAVWLNDRAELVAVESEHTRVLKAGRTVSVFPVGSGPWELSSEGLKWALQDYPWTRTSVGVSNEATRDSVSIAVHSGRVLVVYPYIDD